MPTRISAGVGDHPCTVIPIDCKITNFFSLYLCLIELFVNALLEYWEMC